MIKIRKKSIYPFTYDDILNDGSGQSIYHIENQESCILVRSAYHNRFVYWICLENGRIEKASTLLWQTKKFKKSDKMLCEYFPQITHGTTKIKSLGGQPVFIINGTILMASEEYYKINSQEFINKIPM